MLPELMDLRCRISKHAPSASHYYYRSQYGGEMAENIDIFSEAIAADAAFALANGKDFA